MKRVAIIVQRFGRGITGGSEAEAYAYARLLSAECEVEVLTTTARDMVTWSNELAAGLSVEDGLNVRRFSVSVGRSRYWEALYDILMRTSAQNVSTSFAFEEEWIRRQGPHSADLLAFLEENKDRYSAFLYFTYLYSPAYFGLQITPPERNILVPTLHEEPAAGMKCFRILPGRSKVFLFNTKAEQTLAARLWPAAPVQLVAGFPVGAADHPLRPAKDYVLYAGRIEPGKGCDELLAFFAEARNALPGLRLVLIGRKEMKLPREDWLEFRGFVSEDEKRTLMESALCFAMPSRHESFSIVSLEAMAAGVPVVAADSPVLRDHIEQSGCGRIYTGPEEFAAAISAYRSNPELRAQEGEQGRAYVQNNYSPERIKSVLLNAVDSAAGSGAPG